MILLFFSGTFTLIQYYIDQGKSAISKNSSGWMYVPSITEEKINGLDIDKAYPFYDASLLIYGNEYPVIPYYDESNIKDLDGIHCVKG